MTTVTTTDWVVCEDCADIIIQGCTDLIDDMDEHISRVDAIDNLIPHGHYWLGTLVYDTSLYYETCECCGVEGAQYTCQSAVNT